MLQYSPDLFQWLLLTSSAPAAFILITIGLGLVLWMFLTAFRSEKEQEPKFLSLGIPGILLVLIGLIIPSFASTTALANGVATNLSETAKLKDVQLLHLETVSDTPFADGSVVYIGTATDVDGDPRQFRYTQYEQFGIYEMVGFDKPAVDLKDESFKSTEKGLEIYKGTEGTTEDSPKVDPEETAKPQSTEKPSETPTPKS